ncbi:hypothetical protein BU26DRAFT_183896 [Trematosphaeria pertusa]|uniref:Uncharacterized protein n=1 Tax=Trematosphaeria pertusa TaxID=390896 RepID=A0A6A6HST9_9PLEO|nr:uncharacterized protein BU26DRAFT_183896 [Trematosphaeria pertusa]KAF2241254.1 hypothetical protein BU26DRAFT_183896 [Trematosphaeria pertusa]
MGPTLCAGRARFRVYSCPARYMTTVHCCVQRTGGRRANRRRTACTSDWAAAEATLPLCRCKAFRCTACASALSCDALWWTTGPWHRKSHSDHESLSRTRAHAASMWTLRYILPPVVAAMVVQQLTWRRARVSFFPCSSRNLVEPANRTNFQMRLWSKRLPPIETGGVWIRRGERDQR